MDELCDILAMLWHISEHEVDVGTATFISSIGEFEFNTIFEEYAESSAPFVLSSSLITGVSVCIVASCTRNTKIKLLISKV